MNWKAHPLADMGGRVQKYQEFEAVEKNGMSERRLSRPPAEMDNTSRASSASRRSSNQGGGVRMDASSLSRGGVKGGAHRQRERSSGGRKGSDPTERHPTPPKYQQTEENRMGTRGDDKLPSRDNSPCLVGKNESRDEYPPLGSNGGAGKQEDRSPEERTANSGMEDTAEVQRDIPEQQ